MRLGIAVLFALAGAACSTTTTLKPIDLDGSPASIKQSMGRNFARYAMVDGETLFVESPRDFGEAICGDNICIPKVGIREVHYLAEQKSVTSQDVAMAPFMALALLGTLEPRASGPAPTVQNYMPSCARHTAPVPPAQAMTSRTAMAEWVWSNRGEINSQCLQEASNTLAATNEAVNEARAIQLHMLAVAKLQWTLARCSSAVVGQFRVTPSQNFDTDPTERLGDPAWIVSARAIIADPATFDDPLPEGACNGRGGPAAVETWPMRKDYLVSRLDPFSREPLVVFGDPRTTGVPATDAGNRALPSVWLP